METQGANALNNIFTFACFTFVILLTVAKNLNIFSDDVKRWLMRIRSEMCVSCVCVCVFFFFSGQHDNNELPPNSQHNKKTFFFLNMRRVNSSALHLTACSVNVFECRETPRKIFVKVFFFLILHNLLFDTMQIEDVQKDNT